MWNPIDVYSYKGAMSHMSKKKIKTYQQLIEENKKAIMRDPKMMESIYETIDKSIRSSLQLLDANHKHRGEQSKLAAPLFVFSNKKANKIYALILSAFVLM